MKRSILFTLICCLLLILNVKAQKDFIVTVKGDTIYGDLKKNILGILALKVENKDDIKVSFENVKSYFLASKYASFVAKNVPDRKYLAYMELLERGKIDLYEHKARTPEGLLLTTWLASKENGTLYDIITDRLFSKIKPREEIFYLLIGDSQELLDAYKKEKKYNFDVKRNYIQMYNKIVK